MRFFAPLVSFAALLAALFATPALRAEQPVVKEDSAPENDPDIALAFQLERAFQKLAKRVAPCVVSLKVTTHTRDWTEEFRRMSEHIGPTGTERIYEGSGVIVDPEGWIITNEHVVRDADTIVVTFSDQRVCSAVVSGLDKRSDLAMLKLSGEDLPKNLPVAVLADSDKVQVGQYSMAVGNPFGMANSFTMGVISARGRNREGIPGADVFYGNLIQTDAPINPGNSGGPLFDLSGKLIGINTMIFSLTGSSQGCGFAIPSNQLKPRLAYLKVGREIEYGWLGVQLRDLDSLKREFKVPDNKGVMVDAVLPNTPADRAGLQHGMIVLDFDGTRVGSTRDLIAVVNVTPVGRNVKVKVVDTAGKLAELSVRISKRYSELVRSTQYRINGDPDSQALDLNDFESAATPAKSPDGKPLPPDKSARGTLVWRGMLLKEISPDDAKKRGGRIEIVRVKTGSPADRAGLYEGAIVSELKHAGDKAIQKLDSLERLKELTATVTGPVALHTALDGYISVDEK